MLLKESTGSSPFNVLRASLSKLLHTDHDQDSRRRRESPAYRRSSVDIASSSVEPSNAGRRSGRRASISHSQSPVTDFSADNGEQMSRGSQSMDFSLLGRDPSLPRVGQGKFPTSSLNTSRRADDYTFSLEQTGRPPLAYQAIQPAKLSGPGKIDPRLVINELSEIPGLASQCKSRLDLHEHMALYQQDQLDSEERHILRLSKRSSSGTKRTAAAGVFGVSLRHSSIYASTSVVLGGRELELPAVVVSCVEELYRSGLHTRNLFKTLPNPTRLRELVEVFNYEVASPDIIVTPRPSARKRNLETEFGVHLSLHLELIPDICALLSTYLMSLPEPILLQRLFDPLWDWCSMGSPDRSSPVSGDARLVEQQTLPHTNSPTASDAQRIRTAQLVLHLLPSPNLSLLVYLLAFFNQVARAQNENGLSIKDLGAIFGSQIFGDGDAMPSTEETSGYVNSHSERGARMMCWFLVRWNWIARDLFDIPQTLNPVINMEHEPPSPTSAGLVRLQQPRGARPDTVSDPRPLPPNSPPTLGAPDLQLAPSIDSLSMYSGTLLSSTAGPGRSDSNSQSRKEISDHADAVATIMRGLVDGVKNLQLEIEQAETAEGFKLSSRELASSSSVPIKGGDGDGLALDSDPPRAGNGKTESTKDWVESVGRRPTRHRSKSSDVTSLRSGSDLNDRLMGLSISELLNDPILNTRFPGNGLTEKRTASGDKFYDEYRDVLDTYYWSSSGAPTPARSSTQVSRQTLELGASAASLSHARRYAPNRLLSLEEELRICKEHNARAFDALAKANIQIAHLESRLKKVGAPSEGER